MKRTHLLILLLCPCWMSAFAQTGTTAFGTGAGTAGNYNSNLGYNAGNLNTSGGQNSFLGYYAGYSNTSSSANNGIGLNALYSLTTGTNNVAIGALTLTANTTGYSNTAIGRLALNHNISAVWNTAAGSGALLTTTTGGGNSAAGYFALSATNKNYGTAAGYSVFSNADASGLTGAGYRAGDGNISGANLTAMGALAMVGNTTGTTNTAVGYSAQYTSSSGNYNTSDGANSLYYATGSQNSAFGFQSGPGTASPALTNTTSLGYGAIPTASNTVMLGNSSVTSVETAISYNGSDGRFKTDVREDVAGLSFINQLRPVSYLLDIESLDSHMNLKSDGLGTSRQVAAKLRRTGFIAQEIEAAQKKSGRAFSGVWKPKNEKDVYRVDYDGLVVPLVRSVQELNLSFVAQQQQIDSITSLINIYAGNLGGGTGRLIPSKIQSTSVDNFLSVVVPSTAQKVIVMISDMDGAEIKSFTLTARGNVSLPIVAGTFGPGLYISSLIIDNDLADSKKIIFTK